MSDWPKKRYMILESLAREDLEEKVNIWLAKGWQCQGGVCAFLYWNEDLEDSKWGFGYSQAMILLETK